MIAEPSHGDGANFTDTVELKGDEMIVTAGGRTDAKGPFTPIQKLKRLKVE
jgi:hypothetical protein